MADDDTQKQHAIYGSAGMAAAGMIRTGKSRGKSPKEPTDEKIEEEEVEAVGITERADSLSDLVIGTEEPAPPEPPVVAEEPADDEKNEEEEQEKEIPLPVFQGHRAVVIGHTGRGNFGHGLDLLFRRLDGVRLVAIVDGEAEALEESHARSGAERAYADYREMLEQEKPDLVSVAPRWTDQHYEMVKAALEAGAHVCCERPLCRTLKEADELLALAAEKNLKIAVVHQMRCDPHVALFHEQREELIGELVEMKVFGMMDHRAGGEDLLVLGTHLFDLVRWFGGEASYCTAQITKEGRPVIAEEAHFSEKEDLGPLLGDAIHAEFAMDSGVHVSYVSDQRLSSLHGPWGIEFVGTNGKARLFAGMPPTLSLLVASDPASPDREDRWQRWPAKEEPYHEPVEKLSGTDAANRLVVNDWLAAIADDREPACSGRRAMKSLEMIHGVWQAGATMKRAYFPLTNRLHPLSEESL
ncbi:MAG: Gfo/Idh/MocA family oxidoreductase [Verrucomicrobiaceae bacterium]|nr:Gfo/Idh/MocA family oxidoreductase [Verrucomicrobiaceae bacterium]